MRSERGHAGGLEWSWHHQQLLHAHGYGCTELHLCAVPLRGGVAAWRCSCVEVLPLGTAAWRCIMKVHLLGIASWRCLCMEV